VVSRNKVICVFLKNYNELKFKNFFELGLLHISQISFYKVDSLEGYFDQGEKIFVKVISIGDDGKIGLSMKYADQSLSLFNYLKFSSNSFFKKNKNYRNW